MKTRDILVASALGLSATAQAQKPNIIYIFTDQQSAQAMSCSGNSDLTTPAMDRLAREGVRFTNAYCAAPLSTPSRASMMTGVAASVSGNIKNGTKIQKPYDDTTLGKQLTAAGYQTAYAGKWHLPSSNIPDKTEGFDHVYDHNDIGIADACGEYIGSKREAGKPLFMVVSLDNPHNICEYVRDQNIFYADLKEADLKDCPNLPSNFAIAPFDAHVIQYERQSNFKVYPTIYFTVEDWRRYRNAYYRLTESVDSQIGRLLSYLDKYKMWDNTVVIFSSDHGDGNGAHNWNQKSALYEEATNIPFIVRLPKGVQGGRVSQALVNNGVDLYATICDYASAQLPQYCLGSSLRPVLEGKQSGVNDYVVSETLFDTGITYGWSVRTPNFKYTVYDKGRYREQLYDMQSDRGEMVNLAVESKYADVLNDHRRMLVEWHNKNGVKKDIRATPILK